MTNGRKICDILKDIRKTVGESEGLNLNQSECSHKGECMGTCPKCESELAEINKKVSHNRLVAIGTATLAAVSLSACNGAGTSSNLSGDVIMDDNIIRIADKNSDGTENIEIEASSVPESILETETAVSGWNKSLKTESGTSEDDEDETFDFESLDFDADIMGDIAPYDDTSVE